MTDIALQMGRFTGDLSVSGGDLLRDDGLETAVSLSLFTDRRATRDLMPDVRDVDLRGYWGDVATVVEGDQTGSLLWTLAREKETAQTLARARQYARDALQWMLDDKVASKIEVAASYVARGVMMLTIDIYRPGLQPVRYRYDFEWAAQAAKRAA